LISCKNTNSSKSVNQQDNDSIRIEESFIDSTNIGIAGIFKINILQIRHIEQGVYMTFDLFKKQNNNWTLIQSYKMEKDGITSLDIVISDFNNDGLNDMTVQTGAAARGSNEIKSLFLFDKSKGDLKLIKNSSNYPNIRYNKELDCIDAWLIYGGSSTIFFKLDSDTLREFAGVELFDSILTIYQIDSNGKKIILVERKEDKLDTYTRFLNYKPLKIDKESK
jgi:hypothetical protein